MKIVEEIKPLNCAFDEQAPLWLNLSEILTYMYYRNARKNEKEDASLKKFYCFPPFSRKISKIPDLFQGNGMVTVRSFLYKFLLLNAYLGIPQASSDA